MITRLLFTAATIAVLISGRARSQCDAGEVTIYLKNGRSVSGQVDSRTNDDLLWLRTSSPGIVLRSAFEWTRIAHARHDNQALTPEELRKLSSKLKSDIPNDFFTKRQPKQAKAVPANKAKPAALSIPAFDKRRVRSLKIESIVANWDDDVEPDGLRIFVYPLDADGRIVSVDGSLDVKLIGQTQLASSWSRRRRILLFPELGRWRRKVRRNEFGQRGAVYEIPFKKFHPEFNLDIAPDAVLTARLGIPGRGTFDASDANVDLRPYSRMRDELQLFTKSRFSPAEFTRRHP